MPNGSSATPIAERAPHPASPSTSISCEQPSITCGARVNPGEALTIPNTFDHTAHPVQRAQFRDERGEELEAGEAGGVEVEIEVDLAGDDAAVGPDRAGAREEHQVTGGGPHGGEAAPTRLGDDLPHRPR